MAEKRDLEFFMANPHELPGNLDELEATLTGDGGEGGEAGGTIDAAVAAKEGTAAAANPGESGVASNAAAGTKDPNAADAGGKPAPTEPAGTQVILSKNGKHEIPYSVLEAERQSRVAAEAAAQELREQIEQLQQQVQAGTKPAAAAATPPADNAPSVPVIDEATVRQIEEDNPEQGKVIRALMGQVSFLAEQLGAVRNSEASRQHVEQNTRANTVQEVIDANPQLRFWQAEQPEKFARAVEFDKTIRSDPSNKGLPLNERFAKVVSAMEAVYGKTDLPPGYTSAAAPTPPASAGKGAAPAAERPPVSSLSEIPGGVPPMADEIEQLGQLSASDLGNKFLNMDPNKVLAILARAA